MTIFDKNVPSEEKTNPYLHVRVRYAEKNSNYVCVPLRIVMNIRVKGGGRGSVYAYYLWQ